MSQDRTSKTKGPSGPLDRDELARFAERARRLNEERMAGYREQSLKIHPWVCARCGRHFTLKNLRELTVHHKDHDHNNNPPDGSNWEHLCIYCHDAEHGRLEEDTAGNAQDPDDRPAALTHNPFAVRAGITGGKDKA